MCGIVGIVSPNPQDLDHLTAMTDALRHRGPDARGEYRAEGIGLGHRRLAILDLSPAANQPMANEDDSLWLVANGEIYNYRELNRPLLARGHHFRSAGDCETLLHGYEERELEMLDQVNGMFAFILWDGRRRRLVAAVDRFGKKPLYYARQGNRLALASEPHALLHLPWVDRTMDPAALDRYLALRYVPAPYTLFQGIRKLEPATMLVWQDGSFSSRRYWLPRSRPILDYGPRQVEEFSALFDDAVRLRLQSEVPLGIYLSGGVDSAAVGSSMVRQGQPSIVSYTVGFDYQYNEIPRAERLANHLGMQFNPVTVAGSDFDRMPEIVFHSGEPFGDLLALSSYLLARRAKEQLTVVLTGDGADEILNGYLHHKLLRQRQRYQALLRHPLVGRLAAGVVETMPTAVLNRLFEYPDRLQAREKKKLVQMAGQSADFGRFYETTTSCLTVLDKREACNPEWRRDHDGELAEEYRKRFDQLDGFDFMARLSWLDLYYWIPFSALFRLDKLNMAHAVETRSPFLDYRLVEMALNLPVAAKFNPRRNKEILRAMLDERLPEVLREKGKQAFYVPVTDATRDRFRTWTGDLLSEATVRRRGWFRPAYIQELTRLSKEGSMLANRQLTAMAMLEEWQRLFHDRSDPATPPKAVAVEPSRCEP